MSASRREFLRRLVAASALVVTGLVSFLALAETQIIPESQQTIGTMQQSSTTAQQSVTGTQTAEGGAKAVPSGYILVAPLSALSGRTAAYFNHPKFGASILLVLNGVWKAFSAACTHAGCTVQYTGSSLYCPCHAGYFSPSDGAVQGGPPPSPLPEYGTLVQDSNVYVTNQTIN